MSVRIGHASISERNTVNGQKGDQTGREVCVRSWYSFPWDFMAVHPDPLVRIRHAKAVEQACNNNNIGYGQSDRNTLYSLAKAAGFDLSKVSVCNCDCSSLQNVAAVASGSGATYGSNGWTTFNMEAELRKLGYKIIKDAQYLRSADYCLRGAIYVSTLHHTAAGLDDGAKADVVLRMVGSAPAATMPDPARIDAARSLDRELDGTYTTTANLNLRAGAGVSKTILAEMPRGSSVRCYGYYTETDGVKWLCVVYGGRTGFCSSEYLEKSS